MSSGADLPRKWPYAPIEYPFDITKHFAVYKPNDHSEKHSEAKHRRLLTWAYYEGEKMCDQFQSKRVDGKREPAKFAWKKDQQLNLRYEVIGACKVIRKRKGKQFCVCEYHNEYYASASDTSSASAVDASSASTSDASSSQPAVPPPPPPVQPLVRSLAPVPKPPAFPVDQLPVVMKALGSDAEWVGRLFFTVTGSASKPLVRKQKVPDVFTHPPPPPAACDLGYRLPKTETYYRSGFGFFDAMHQFGVRLCCPGQCKKVDCIAPEEDSVQADGEDDGPPPQFDDSQPQGPAFDPNGVELRSKGLHDHVRLVMGADEIYKCIAAKYECPKCKKRFVAWSEGIMKQIPAAYRSQYGVILTTRGGVRQEVIDRMCQRKAGDSATALQAQLREAHFKRFCV